MNLSNSIPAWVTKLLPTPRELKYTEVAGVRHPDPSVLKRPFDTPKHIWATAIVAAIVAAGLGGSLAYQAVDQLLNGSEREAAEVEENINRDVSYDFALLTDLISLSDEEIVQYFADAGYLTYQYSDEDENLDIMKLPSDVDTTEAAELLEEGIDSMDAVTASFYLTGSWRFSTDRDSGLTMSIRYVDLAAADAEEAIQTALDAQGWTMAEDATMQTDSVGNTYVEGTIQTDAGTCTWRVAAIDSDEVYDISGLPETAQYVGVHLIMN